MNTLMIMIRKRCHTSTLGNCRVTKMQQKDNLGKSNKLEGRNNRLIGTSSMKAEIIYVKDMCMRGLMFKSRAY